MDLSAEKRKMPRMKVDLSACIFWGLAKNQSEVTVRNLSIHGISFRARKYLPRGTQFNLVIPNQRKDSETHNIQAEVVRCESLDGFSSNGKFKVGAKFSFKAHKSTDHKEKPTTKALSPLKPIDSPAPVLNHYNERLKNYPVSANTMGVKDSPALGVRILEINAELIRSVRTSTREETVVTRIQIKQARFVSSLPTSSSKLSTSRSGDSQKLLSPEIVSADHFF
jgi:hypothetical protein